LLVPLGPALYRLAGPWNGIRPRPAMTLQNDAMLWAKYGACFCDVESCCCFFSAAISE
jgi:hypothetical protein